MNRKKNAAGEFVHTVKGSHNHLLDPRDAKVDEVVAKAVKLAQETGMTTKEIIGTAKAGQSRDVLAQLPSDNALSNKIRKERSSDHPVVPNKLEDLVLPEKYTKSAEGEDIVWFDSGQKCDRIIILATQTNMDFLATCDSIHMDGTFSTCPVLFNQLYVVIGTINL